MTARFHRNSNRRSRVAAADGGPQSSDDEYDDEVFYREQSQHGGNQGHLLFAGMQYNSQSQSQTQQGSQSPTGHSSSTTTSSEAAAAASSARPVQLMPRHERRRRAREMMERMNEYYEQGESTSSPSDASQAESTAGAAPENAFASLELLLNQQVQQQQVQQQQASLVAPVQRQKPQVGLLQPEAQLAAPEPPAEQAPAVVDERSNVYPLNHHSPPIPAAMGPTTGTIGDPQGPLVPAASAPTTTTMTTTTTTCAPLGDADFTNEFGANDASAPAWDKTNTTGRLAEGGNYASEQTVQTTQGQKKTKRSRGRDHYNVPTPSYTSFSPCRSSSISNSSRRLGNPDPGPRPTSLLEMTRRIEMKQAKSTAAAAAAVGTRTERGFGTTTHNAQQHRASLQSRKPVSIVNSKSIVGTRPKHWGGSTARKLGSTGRTVLVSANKRSSLAAELSKAAQTRTLMPPPPRIAPPKRARTDEGLTFLSRVLGASAEALPQQNMDTTTLSFTPAFLSSRIPKTVPEEDQVEGNESFSDALLTLSPRLGSPAGMYSPPSRKTAKGKTSKAGPLSRRLKVIRDAAKGDSVRFQCGQYPFSAKAVFDMSDPRNRAKSYMDVTVMGNSCSWAKDSQQLTFLAFIHTHEPTTQAAAGNDTFDSKKCLAWLCCSFETARGQGLRIGSELRIYNAVAIPIANKSDSKDPVDFIVLCTQLCEPYPAVLPKLPDVATINSMTDQSIEA